MCRGSGCDSGGCMSQENSASASAGADSGGDKTARVTCTNDNIDF